MSGLLEEIDKRRESKKRVIDVAMGRIKADVVFKNATYVNIFTKELVKADIAVAGNKIAGIGEYEGIKEVDATGKIIIPGFIDAHIHLESSLVSPAEFAKAVVSHGTTAVITDPHEITNVMGTNGIQYIIEATNNLPLDVKVMLPSCVPATSDDESGAILDYQAIDSFYNHKRVIGLAEMMNYVGVYLGDTDVLNKIAASEYHNKIVDGHAPGLSGKELNAYAASGVYSDHECSCEKEAIEKIKMGQHILIREGTAAKNLNALLPIIKEQYAERLMFCCDDAHPLDLIEKGHIDYIVKKAIKAGVDPILAIRIACYNPAVYFGLDGYGAIAPGYNANLLMIDDFDNFNILQVYKDGVLQSENGKMIKECVSEIDDRLVVAAHNTFNVKKLSEKDFEIKESSCPVIGMIPGEIVTEQRGEAFGIDIQKDILKIAVIERHKGTGHIGLGYINGYGMKSGAVATSISHDSHNIIVVGTNEKDMAKAANQIIEIQGGITVVENEEVKANLTLKIAGLMSDDNLIEVNKNLEEAKRVAHELGVNEGIDPFMTLSFMSLTVIPSIRLSTKGIVTL